MEPIPLCRNINIGTYSYTIVKQKTSNNFINKYYKEHHQAWKYFI
jgi:hypothetical protein